jgi:hypothetical protein
MKGVVKLAEIADLITVDIGKFPNKNHSHHNDGMVKN